MSIWIDDYGRKGAGMGLILVVVCAITAVLISIVAARFRNAALTRITAAQGVQEHAYITLGGIEQYVQIRGEDRRNPVILWLHGGPGFPLTYMTGHYQAELERDYTVAVWEQRGCRRTLHRNPNVSNPTIDELLSDVDELVDHLRKRFDRDAIILVGQSWGTVLATDYIRRHPRKVAAYIGVGQVTEFLQGKILAAQQAADRARAKGNIRDATALIRGVECLRATKCLGQLDVKMLENMVITSMKYLRNKAEMSGVRQMWTALTSPQMRGVDVKWFLFASNARNIIESQRNLVDYMYFRHRIEDLKCRYPMPVCFIQGDSDWITPTPMVRDYYATVVAERKEMVVIQSAGHTPFLDHPQRFCAAVKEFLTDCQCGASQAASR